ncbi:MAG: hypothetical protein ACK5RL_15890 [Acidimicrobiales bacterium]
MSDADSQPEPISLATHLDHLAADADDVVDMLNRQHEAGGDIHPEALPKAARLQTSLKQVIDALHTHPHLAAGSDDVWAMLNREHHEHTGGTPIE